MFGWIPRVQCNPNKRPSWWKTIPMQEHLTKDHVMKDHADERLSWRKTHPHRWKTIWRKTIWQKTTLMKKHPEKRPSDERPPGQRLPDQRPRTDERPSNERPCPFYELFSLISLLRNPRPKDVSPLLRPLLCHLESGLNRDVPLYTVCCTYLSCIILIIVWWCAVWRWKT